MHGHVRYGAVMSDINEKQQPSLWRTGRWLFVLGACFYLLTTSNQPYIGDGDLVYYVAESIVDRGSICIDRGRGANTYKIEEGCRVTDYGLGISLALVPGVVLMRAVEALGLEQGPVHRMVRSLLVYLAPAMIGGLIWLFFFVLAARLCKSRKRALWCTLLLGTTTTIWFYSRTFFSEGLQTCALLGCVTALHAYRERGQKTRVLILGAMAFGVAVTTKSMVWMFSPLLVVYLVWGKWHRAWRVAAMFSVALIPFVVLQLAHNYIRFEDIFDFGYHTSRDKVFGFSNPLVFGVWSFLFSPSKSFFLFNPIALFALWGWKRFFKKCKPEAVLFVGFVVITVFIYGRWWAWSGDWSWGPRFLTVLVPFMAIPALFLLPDGLNKHLVLRFGVVGLVVLAFYIQFLGNCVPSWKFITVVNNATGQSFPGYERKFGGQINQTMDEQIPSHYLPHFSHILGNRWLFKHLVEDDVDFKRDYPWKSLGITAWEPRENRINYGLDWWGAVKHAGQSGAAERSGAVPSGAAVVFCCLVSLVLLGLMILGCLCLFRLSWAEEKQRRFDTETG